MAVHFAISSAKIETDAARDAINAWQMRPLLFISFLAFRFHYCALCCATGHGGRAADEMSLDEMGTCLTWSPYGVECSIERLCLPGRLYDSSFVSFDVAGREVMMAIYRWPLDVFVL